MPPGVFNIVTGDGQEVGARLASHPDVGKIAFTGSTEVGREIMRLASGTVKKVSLELGGKGPVVVLDDADLDAAVDAALFGCWLYAGQMCESGTRLLLPDALHDEFVDRMIERAKTVKVGDPTDFDTDLGPVISREQRDRILSYIEIGKQEGATVAFGGGVPEGPEFERGYWVEPDDLHRRPQRHADRFLSCSSRLPRVRPGRRPREGQKDKEKAKGKAETPAPEAWAFSMPMGFNEGSYLGVYLEEVTPERAKELGLKEERGALVMKVVEGSPAEKAGLKENDTIVSFNGRRVNSVREMQRMLGETPVGRNVTIEIVRGGNQQTISATLSKRSSDFALLYPGGREPRLPREPREPRRPETPEPRPESSVSFISSSFPDSAASWARGWGSLLSR